MSLEDAYKALGVIDLFLAVGGTVGNSLILLTCVTRLRDQVTFVFIAFLAVTDTAALYEWNLSHFSDAFFDYNIFVNRLMKCRFMNFFQYSSLQASAWLLLLMTVERNLSVWIPTWRLSVFKPKHAFICCTTCIVILVLANSNVLFTFGTDRFVNGTFVETICWIEESMPETNWILTWSTVHSILYSYVPFSIILIANCLLIYKVHSQRSSRSLDHSASQQKRQRAITLTIIAITLLFILFTGVGTVVNFFIDELLQTYWGNVVIVVGDTLCFTFHGLNIISLLVTNKVFRKEFFGMLNYSKTGPYSVKSSTNAAS